MAARAPARMFFGNKNKGKGKGKEGSAPKKPATLGELAALNTARFKGAKSASGGAAGFANAKKVRTYVRRRTRSAALLHGAAGVRGPTAAHRPHRLLVGAPYSSSAQRSTTAASRSLSRDQGSSQITTCLIVFSWAL